MQKKPVQTNATRQAFIDAFCQLAIKKSLTKISIQELAQRAGYNRCTFYQYFQDINDLLVFLEEQLIRRIKEAVLKNMGCHSMERSFILAFSDIHQQEKRYFDTLLKLEQVNSFGDRLKKIMIPALIELLKIPSQEKKAVYALEFYFGGVISATSRWLLDGRELNTDEIAALIRSLSNEGVWPYLTASEVDK